MDCERVAELLPWAKNGTLAGPEQGLVREHLGHCRKCQRELIETNFAWSVYQQHVPAEVLVDLAYDSAVVPAQRALFDRHLSACPDCAEQLELVRASRRLETEQQKEASLQVLPLLPKRAVWWQRTPVWKYGAIAATLLLIIAAGGWWRTWQQSRNPAGGQSAQEQSLRERLAGLEAENLRLREAEAKLNQQQNQSSDELARLRAEIQEAQTRIGQQQEQLNRELAVVKGTGRERGAPQINVLALDIYPLGMTQRDGGQAGNEIVIPGNVTGVTLMLHSQAPTTSPSYNIEIVNSRGRVVWKARGLQRNATNDYTIGVPANYLQPGRYTINIYGKGEKVEAYQVSVKREL